MIEGQKPAHEPPAASTLRIIGGTYRGRKLLYTGDPRTRPMKDRVREAVFNLLGPAVVGKHVLDLFAGTGALGLEALSRGAARASFFEQHFPTAGVIRQNIELFAAADKCQVIAANTFLYLRRHLDELSAGEPWLVFCSPPYAFYTERRPEMLQLIGGLLDRAQHASVLVVEADMHFDFAALPQADQWNVRDYPPARVAIQSC